jgi:hypothetical protein
VGISIDSKFSHAAWASEIGGVSLPLLSDFNPKGAVADSFGLYLQAKGITDRATVLIDAAGKVQWVESVGPGGKRDIAATVDRCVAIDNAWQGAALAGPAVSPGVSADATLFVRDHCMFSRWAMYARNNLHLGDALPIRNVSNDADALAALVAAGGKGQAPALLADGKVMYESADIAAYLAARAGVL